MKVESNGPDSFSLIDLTLEEVGVIFGVLGTTSRNNLDRGSQVATKLFWELDAAERVETLPRGAFWHPSGVLFHELSLNPSLPEPRGGYAGDE